MSKAIHTLWYWPQIPGRGEYIRLAFEAAGAPYQERSQPSDAKDLMGHCLTIDVVPHPPHFAPPILEIHAEAFEDETQAEGGAPAKSQKTQDGQSASASTSKTTRGGAGGSRFLSQTPAILSYLAPQLGLDGTNGSTPTGPQADLVRAQVLQLTLTALDISNEVHDSHHPISVSSYYEDQKDSALLRAADLRNKRLPKFLGYFHNVLEANERHSGFLLGERETIADLTLFQVLDGISFAFPRFFSSLAASGDLPSIFGFHARVKALPNISAYLSSDRRRPYSDGIYRHYPELDGEYEAKPKDTKA